MNIFARKISFFYKNREWAEKIFDKILENTDKEFILDVAKRRDDMWIIYKDGTKVSFRKALENCRGFRHHLIYLEPAVSYDFYECVARPKLIGREYGGGQVFVLSDAEALYHGSIDSFCVDARDYYFKKYVEKSRINIDDEEIDSCEEEDIAIVLKEIAKNRRNLRMKYRIIPDDCK